MSGSTKGYDELLLFSPEMVSQVGMDSGQLNPRCDLSGSEGLLLESYIHVLFFLPRHFPPVSLAWESGLFPEL